MLKFSAHGDLKKFDRWTQHLLEIADASKLDKFGRQGVEGFRDATPVDTGQTAEMWYYKIIHGDNGPELIWDNNNINQNFEIWYGIVEGHGTGTGGYVPPNDFVTPVLEEVAEDFVDYITEEVKDA